MSTEITISNITPLETTTEVTVATGLNLIQYLTDLADTPNSYAGSTNKYLRSTGSGMAWADAEATQFGGKPPADYISGDNERGSINWTTGVNTINKSGFYSVSTDLTGLPNATKSHVLHTTWATTSGYATQRCKSNLDEYPEYTRTLVNGVWSTWEEITSGINQFAMTKAEFNALKEKRIRDGAGSGFSEWGKAYSADVSNIINEGMWAVPATPNQLVIGRRRSSDGAGVSKTDEAIVNVSGVQFNLSSIVDASTQANILFPDAPDGTKSYNSSTGVVTTHATSNDAFGVIPFTDFNQNGTATWNSTTGIVTFTGSGVGAITANAPRKDATNGDDIELSLLSSIDETVELRDGSSSSGALMFSVNLVANVTQKVKVAGYARTSDSIYIRVPVPNTGATLQVFSPQVIGVNETVITSRKDLVFLETWLEDISEKDIVVPFGNVQCGASSYEGIGLVDLTSIGVAQGYSAFGEWDTTTVGKGNQFSALTDTQKKIYLADPRNNIFYDAETDKLYQWRYRVRVVEGLGDEWIAIRPSDNSRGTEWARSYVNKIAKRAAYVQGAADSITNNYIFVTKAHSHATELAGDNGAAESQAGIPSSYGVGKIIALPIALVQR